MYAWVVQSHVATESDGADHVMYAAPDSKSSDKVEQPIVPLKVATRKALLLKSQHLIILMLARDVCKPSLQGRACMNMNNTMTSLVPGTVA